MNVKTRENTQKYSDIKVSKETATVFKALADYSTLFESVCSINGLTDNEIEDYVRLMEPLRDKLDKELISSIIAQQSDTESYTYKVI